jgi:ABC-type dipeptide/oligopeptide/nickel transport system permease subunit
MGWCARGALAVLVLMALAALLAPLLAPFDPLEQDLMLINSPPGSEHFLGTDSLGRDILSRLIMGARLSFSMSIGATVLALLLGLGLGGLACAFGRVTQGLYFAFVDLIRSMPGILLCMVLLVSLGSGTGSVVIALAVTFMPLFAHMALSAYRREMATDYVRIARGYGTGVFRLLRVHLLPNIAGVFITQSTIILARVIVTESVLSFLGLGVHPETPTWGRMVAIAVAYIEEAPHAAVVPITALVITTISLVVLGDWLRVRFDPIRNA